MEQHARAGESGERHATVILSKSAHVTATVGFLLCVFAGIAGASIWMTRIADDVSSIRSDMRQIVGTLTKTTDDHETRIRDLEHPRK